MKLQSSPICSSTRTSALGSKRLAPAGVALALVVALSTLGPSRADDLVKPETAPLPPNISDALGKEGLTNIDKVVIVHQSGPPTIWYTSPVDYDHPMDVDPLDLAEGVYSLENVTDTPFYFLKGKGCIKCGKQCCF